VRCTFYKGGYRFFTNGAGALHLTCLRQKRRNFTPANCTSYHSKVAVASPTVRRLPCILYPAISIQ